MQEKETPIVSYKYYLLGETVPIRVAFNEKGDHIGAEVPNREKGKLIQDATYLGRILNSIEVDEISQEDFEKLSKTMLSNSPSR